MLIAEVFGHAIEDDSDLAWAARRNKACPFRGSPCHKSSKEDPIGICSLSDGHEAASLCPVRFTEGNRIFVDAARLAFGDGISFAVVPEVRILRIKNEKGADSKKIGKVDYLLAKIGADQTVKDFAAVEVQAAYFSGNEIRTPMHYYLNECVLDHANSDRRPDFRSSAQKRLVPQLRLKVPVFRRWGKKFFVVVDTQFFKALPSFTPTTAANSEVTWLNYPIRLGGDAYTMQDPQVIYSEFDEVLNSLREGTAPEPQEIIDELQAKLKLPPAKRPKVLST